MKTRALVGALVAAGVIGTGVAAYNGRIDAPVSQAYANPVTLGGVATPAANPGATTHACGSRATTCRCTAPTTSPTGI